MPNDDRALTDLSISELPDFNSERIQPVQTDFIPIYDSVAGKYYRIRATDLVRVTTSFTGSLVLVGDEIPTRFVWIGETNNETFTLALATNVGDGYSVILSNNTSSGFAIDITPSGADTLNGSATPIALARGQQALITKDSGTNYIVSVVG
jgi:hypothetical protein